MEEITLRFEIVRLAVELGDVETIELQCTKLRSISLDDRLNEIIDLLETKNFRQALYEMKHYHQSIEDEFFEEKRPEKKKAKKGHDWYEQGLFAAEESVEEEEERTLDIDDILRLSEGATRVPEPEPEEANDDAFLQIEPVAKEPRSVANVEEPADTEEEPAHESWEAKHKAEEEAAAWELEETEIQEPHEPEPEPKIPQPSVTAYEPGQIVAEEEMAKHREEPEETEPELSKREALRKSLQEESSSAHPPISYIGQKFRNMIHQFPPLERGEVLPPEVEKMRKKIAEEGYTDEEIGAFLEHYNEYRRMGQRAAAAQVLLLAAATDSKFAQFLLARELYRGDVLQKDHAEAFTQMNTLADQDFAEAICDLGQFYEYGIGIGKDRHMALLLFEEAAELGVVRARKHYERLKNSRGLKGLFGKVKVPSIPLPKKK